jgi:tetratricopeptide (TPR) repeat protein
LRILLSVCNAVAFAHSRGIIHRDLKPENVMVGAYGEVLVMDWGLAVDYRNNPTEALRTIHKLTIKEPAGSPAYMAPEMALGLGEHLGPWTDVYLLGAVLFEVLMGRPPHQTEGHVYASLLKAAEADPPMFGPETPSELGLLCRRAMARQPRNRFRSVAEFQDALEDYLGHRESLMISDRAEAEMRAIAEAPQALRRNVKEVYSRYAKVISRHEEAIELWDGNRRARAGLLAAREAYAREALRTGDLGLAESLVGGMGGGEAAQALRREVQAEQAARARRERAARRIHMGLRAAVAAIVLGVVVASLVIAAKSRETMKAVKAQQQAERERGQEEVKRLRAEEGQRNAELNRHRAEAEKKQAELDKQQAELDKRKAELAAAERARRRVKAFEPYAQAMDLINRGQRLDDAVLQLQQALKIDAEFPEAQFALGEAFRFYGDPVKAAEAYEQADALSRALGGQPHLQALLAAGFALENACVYDRAESLFARAEELGKKDEPLSLVGRTFRLGHAHRWREASQAARQAHGAGAHLWETHVALGFVTLEGIANGVLRGDAKTLKEGVGHFERALALAPRQAEICQWLALALLRRNGPGDRDRVVALLDRAIDLEPRNGVRFVYRARARHETDKAAALADFEKGRSLGAGQVAVLQTQAMWAMQEGRYPEARQALKSLVERAPTWPMAMGNYLLLSVNMKLDQEVKPLIERWCPENGNYFESYQLLAHAAIRREDYKKAAEIAHQGLAIAPYNEPLHRILATAHYRGGRFAEALKAADAGLEACTEVQGLRLVRAQCLLALNRLDEAERELDAMEKQKTVSAETVRRLREAIQKKKN